MAENPRSSVAEDMAAIILDAKAVSIKTNGGYKWKSGIWSPVYSDLRLLISNVDARTKTSDHLLTTKKHVPYDLIAGTATAGIVWATKMADALRLPMVYVRSSEKDHGKENLVEGLVNPDDRTLVAEDTVSTAESSINAANALRGEGAIVEDILGIMTYGLEKSVEDAGNAGIEIQTVTNFPVVMQLAEEGEYWKPSEVRIAREWFRDPYGWEPTS